MVDEDIANKIGCSKTQPSLNFLLLESITICILRVFQSFRLPATII